MYNRALISRARITLSNQLYLYCGQANFVPTGFTRQLQTPIAEFLQRAVT